MGDYRSKSFAEGRKQVQTYYAQRSMSNLRGMRSCCSFDATYAPPPLPTQTFDSTYAPPTQMGSVRDKKLKKSKSTSGSSWRFSDPEVQRKKRVASYKVYSVEEKVKGSFRKSFKWIKDRYNHVVYGWSAGRARLTRCPPGASEPSYLYLDGSDANRMARIRRKGTTWYPLGTEKFLEAASYENMPW